MNTLRFGNNKIDIETLFMAILISVMISIGGVAFFGGITGIAVMNLGILTVGGIIFGFAGIIFGILIFMYLIER